jgi:hypothetical protein
VTEPVVMPYLRGAAAGPEGCSPGRTTNLPRRACDGSLYACILLVPGLGTALELRLDPGRAERHRLSDPVTTAVGDRATLAARDQYLPGRASSTPRSSPLSRPGSLSCPTRTATGCASAR